MKLKIKHNKIQYKTERIKKKNLPRNRLNNTFTIDKISILSIYVRNEYYHESMSKLP